MLAGPNGAGKSTLYRAAIDSGLLPPEAEFVNADLYEAQALQHVTGAQARSLLARQWADARREQLLAAGQSFVSETVFSHPSKIALIRTAREAGFQVMLLIVCVDDPAQLVQRVAQRVEEGGHAVPVERILARYPRTLANLKQAIGLADLSLLYDTSAFRAGDIMPPRLIAKVRMGRALALVNPLPTWAQGLVST